MPLLVQGFCVFYEGQFIAHVNTEVFVILYCLHTDPMNGNRCHWCSGPPHPHNQLTTRSSVQKLHILKSANKLYVLQTRNADFGVDLESGYLVCKTQS